jgi:hypothetical protein
VLFYDSIIWIIWGIALLIRGVSIRKSPYEALSPMTFVIVGFFWLYVVEYFSLDPWSRTIYLSETGYLRVLLLASIAIMTFWIGFRRPFLPKPSAIRLKETPLKVLGIVLIALGSAGWMYFLTLSGGYYTYYSAPHGAAGAWESTSAYLYGTILLLFPGSFILLALLYNRRLVVSSLLALLWSLGFIVLDAWLAGQRSSWLRLGILLGVFTLFLKRPDNQSKAVASLLGITAAIVLVTPYIREGTHLGAELRVGELILEALQIGFSEGGPGYEVIFASALIESASEQGIMDYGYHWLHPLVNIIPRLWWPEKPYVSEFSISYDELLWQSFGWVTEKGSVPTGIADAFLRFSWLSPVVWYFLGLMGRRIYSTAREYPDVVTTGYLTAYLYGLLHVITQEFINAFYAFFYMAAPLCLAFSLSRWAFSADVLSRVSRCDRSD